MNIDIRSNIRQYIKAFGKIASNDIPYATMVAMNNIAFDALGTIKKEIGAKLNIKGKSIPSAWRVKKATKAKPYAELYVDEWSWQYKVLKHHYTGGDRARKGMEKAMIHMGLMRQDQILTPPPGVKIKPHTYVEMMSQLKLFYKAGFMANETKASRKRRERLRKKGVRYFAIPWHSSGHMHPGVYARVPGINHPVCMLRIADKPNYQKRLHDVAIVRKVIERRGQKHFSEAFARAMAKRKEMGW
ncbi:phage tail protein [Hydrogenimonas urashimensis]|uniref:phage tail protein n=1 Tax=Hydrogenimonas urashimensis TaxID=2740515 RepID=UPI001916BF0A|nr:phage tail protein [Hydrogenimonas urashimensis]